MLAAVSLARLRLRLPLIVFILLALLCLGLIGFACACFSDQPIQALQRAIAAIPAAPPVLQVWSFVAVLTAAAVVAMPGFAVARSSPAALQRFLF
jgi:hypothetical protein